MTDPAGAREPAPYVSLADFAATFGPSPERPAWVLPEAAALPELLGLRERLEDVIDTVVAVQRADWLHDGVYVGPRTRPEIWTAVTDAARALQIAVPPAILSAVAPSGQGAFGTDARAFVHLSNYFFHADTTAAEARFVTGRACGFIAARHVTAATLYALLVDDAGLRAAARKAVGPALELVLAPAGIAARIALSRWHRAAEVSADRAGLLACRSLDAAQQAMLRIALGGKPGFDADAYLASARAHREADPGRWTELLASEPWLHKRLVALELFAGSAPYAAAVGAPTDGALDAETLERRTAELLGVAA